MKKQTIIYTISAFLLISGLFLSVKGVSADVPPFQIIDLESGWNIFSTPRVLTSHEFSVSEISDNFDIYLLNPISPSGWQTMQEAGQTKFTPLYAYFINNKTGQDQTLKLNNNLNLTPDQRLFQRTLQSGWNAIGIASPSYAIPRGSIAVDTNNPAKILSSIINSTGSVIDFRSNEQLLDSLKISDSWVQKIASEVNSLNDFREYKGYGIFITEETNNYHGMQNNVPTEPPIEPPEGCTSITEGSYTATLASTPVSRTVTGGTGIEAYGINIGAVDSNITIESLDLQISVIDASTAVVQDPGTLISGIKVYKDSVAVANLVQSYNSPLFTLDTSSVYYTSLTGLNMRVTNGATNKLLVVLDTIESFDNNKTVTLNVYGNGIKGKDCASIDRFAALATTRTLTVQPVRNAILTVSTATSNPSSTNILSDATSGVATDTTVLAFNAKATVGNATLTRLEVGYATGASQAIPSVLTLYSGDTVVATCTPNARENGICTFETFRLPIAKDETKSMYAKAQWAARADSSINIFTANIPATSTHSVYERSNGSVQNTTIAALINANTMFLFEQGVKLTFVSGTNTVTTNALGHGTATGTLKFTVQPFGGTLTQFTQAQGATGNANRVMVTGYTGGGVAYASGATYALTVNPPADVADGSSAEVTVTTTVADDGTTNVGLMRFKIDEVFWTVGAIVIEQFNSTTAGNMLDTWVTNFANLE